MAATEQAPVTEILDDVDDVVADRQTVAVGELLDQVQHQSFAPVLLLIGLVMLVPGPADIPGVPVVLGLMVMIVAAQILFGREHLWVPDWIERWKVKRGRLETMVSWARKPAGWLDAVTKPRYEWLVNHAGGTVIAIACILIAMSTPLLELVPFSANLAGAAITAFGLAMMAKDGVLAGLAIAFSVATAAIVFYQIIG